LTTTVERPNRNALSEALDIYRDAMRPFIVRSLRRVRGARIENIIAHLLNDYQSQQFQGNLRRNPGNIEAAIDINDFPTLISRGWRGAFQNEFPSGDKSVKNAAWQIMEARNSVSHPGTQDLDAEFVRSRLFDIADTLGKINAPQQKAEVERIRDELFTPQPEAMQQDEFPQAEGPAEEPAAEAPASRRASSQALTPWREVIHLNTDVAQGSFLQAEFAADLQQVYDGHASATQYGNPVSFFNHTYITPGIRTLLLNTLKRLAGNGGEPVIQTKTGFGGGKTHSLIALYHLVENADALTSGGRGNESNQTVANIRAIMEEAGMDPDAGMETSVAVLVGTHLAPTDSETTENGDPLNTLWGEMAHQLGGQEAYDIIGDAARQGTAPSGRQLDELLKSVAPCVILIDELVAYVRNAGAAQDSIYTFVQALTEAVRRNSRIALVVTLPESAIEAGGEGGQEALTRLDHLLGRIEATWEPLEVHEAFEVVRRRLFGSVIDEMERDRTCEAFSNMYGRGGRSDYPPEASEQRYLERLKECYPIHPEIFDRLYSDWSSIPRFQRTRAVLRMLSTCISRLYINVDSSPLIMPANLTFSDSSFASEFANLLPGNWPPVLTEVDSDNSLTDSIDKGSQVFGRAGGAARRIARCVFLGSAPSGSVRGIDRSRINLGVVMPGQGAAVYNDALNRMSGDLYYLYNNDGRYYFHAEENLNKVVADRAANFDEREIRDKIQQFMMEAVGRRTNVIVFPTSHGDIPDTDFVRLVVLPPDKSLPSRSQESDEAKSAIMDILHNRGDAARVRKNMLLFLGARRDEIRSLNRAIRLYLAWDSIISGSRSIDLQGDRFTQAQTNIRRADSDVRSMLVNAYRWALAPAQPDPQLAEYDLSRWQIDTPSAANLSAITDSAFDKFSEQEALVPSISAAALDTLLKQYIWKDGREHINIDELWDMLTSNVYMHRISDKSVLMRCIEQGVPESKFGYADGHAQDANETAYTDLRFGEPLAASPGGIAEREPGLLVSPEVAQPWKELEAEQSHEVGGGTTSIASDSSDSAQAAAQDRHAAPKTRSIIVNKVVPDDIDLNDISQLREEIIRNLNEDGGEITVSVTVSASNPDGFSENTVRSIRENSAQLGLDFEGI
jgi:predicted AAA+ superfamily ATPase